MIQETLRVGYVPGVEPDRFARRWREGRRPVRLELVQVPWSRQREALAAGEVDLCFVRLPVADADALHLVTLWEELPVAVIGDEDVLSLFEDLAEEDLADSLALPQQDPDDAAGRVELAATGVGHARMPMSLARLHHRKDAVHRVIRDAEPTAIAIAWPVAADDAVRQEFVAVVRGRTSRSGRSSDPSREGSGAGGARAGRGGSAKGASGKSGGSAAKASGARTSSAASRRAAEGKKKASGARGAKKPSSGGKPGGRRG